MLRRALRMLPSLSRQNLQRRHLRTAVTSWNEKKEELSTLKQNPYFDKYAAKLKHLQDEDPDFLSSKLEDLGLKKKAAKKQRDEELAEAAKQLEERTVYSHERKLDRVMKLDLVQDKTAEEIEEIWNEHHSQKDCIYAVIQANEYQAIHEKAANFPTFLYPVPRKEGYEFFLSQMMGNQVYFTPLIAFQAHGENAPPCLTIWHFTELMADKGIVLMEGEYDANIINVGQAQLLVHQMQRYYGLHCGDRFNLVRVFNYSPDSFKHNDLIKELKILGEQSITGKR